MTLVPGSALERILELARWAPSGDNSQPWRFEPNGAMAVVVHGFDTREHCVYDLDGRPSQISLGALLETMSVAASAEGLRMHCSRRAGYPETRPTFDVQFVREAGLEPDPLAPAITRRAVQRRSMSMQPLTADDKRVLEASVGGGHDVVWLESLQERWQVARLMFRNAGLRLTLPEAYQLHCDIIEWGARYSSDRIPDQALGADPLTLRLMRFVMANWPRVRFFNTYLAGTLAPRLQMDLMPALRCAAHVVIRARQAPTGVDDYIAAGRAVQRFWLTATQLGIFQQPEITPLIFGRYVRARLPFTAQADLLAEAAAIEAATHACLGGGVERAVWIGRLGRGPAPTARSTRHPLAKLMVADR